MPFVAQKRPLYVPTNGRNGLGIKFACSIVLFSMIKVSGLLVELMLPVQLKKTSALPATALRETFAPCFKGLASLGVTVPSPLVRMVKSKLVFAPKAEMEMVLAPLVASELTVTVPL